MDLRGQRFQVDFSDDEDESGTASRVSVPAAPSFSSPLIGDIQERSPKPPSLPKPKPSGFPEHKKRGRVSAFKQQRSASVPEQASSPKDPLRDSAPQSPPVTTNIGSPAQDGLSFEERERKEIDRENKQRLAGMSTEEIEEEQRELLSSLDPSLVERLLKRADLDQGRDGTGQGEQGSYIEMLGKNEPVEPPQAKPDKDTDGAMHTPVQKSGGRLVAPVKSVRFEEDDVHAPAESIDLQPASNNIPDALALPAIHFPTTAAAPDLDPADPSFLENLHSKYFPSLPADPSKLAWMAPIPTHGSIADQESPYYPAKEGLPASALRFDFRGGLLPPRIARAMPTTKGLHHHGEAPESAGYTVPELARLARSAFPAQRSLAFQTLGRLLYRLGRGEWGKDSDITRGLWGCVAEGKVIQTLEGASKAEGGHQGSRNYAIEALWLWQKGGGQLPKSA